MMKLMRKGMSCILKMFLWVNVWNFVKRAGMVMKQKMMQEG